MTRFITTKRQSSSFQTDFFIDVTYLVNKYLCAYLGGYKSQKCSKMMS